MYNIPQTHSLPFVPTLIQFYDLVENQVVHSLRQFYKYDRIYSLYTVFRM